MNDKRNRTEQILESLDGSQRASAPDFFYARLKARMQNEIESDQKVWILRPAYALAALIVVLIVNVSVLLKTERTADATGNDNETAQSIASEYSLNDTNSLYDLTTDR